MDSGCLGEEMTGLADGVYEDSSKGQEESRMTPKLNWQLYRQWCRSPRW